MPTPDLDCEHPAIDARFLYAFDLIELNGDDLRRDPLEGRKATLEMILAKSGRGVRFNEGAVAMTAAAGRQETTMARA